MFVLKMLNLALAFILEICMLIGFGWWGFHASSDTIVRVILGVGSVLVVIALWGLFFARHASRRLPNLLRMVGELVLFGLAAVAIAVSGHLDLAIIFAVLVVVNQALIYIWKQ